MSKYLMFNDDQLAKFKTFSLSLKNPHAGAHDAKLRRRAHDEELPAYVAKELDNEGRGPDRYSLERCMKVVRELAGEQVANAVSKKIAQRWPEGMRKESDLENEHRMAQMDDEDDADEDAEDETEQSSVAEEPLEAEDEPDVSRLRDDQFRKQQNRKSDQQHIGEDLPPPFPGRPTPGGKVLPNSPGGTIPRKLAGDAKSYLARFGNAARIDSDPPRNPRKIAEVRKERKTAFLALDSKSKNSYADRFPNAAKIKVL
jgi:hypothetical protein